MPRLEAKVGNVILSARSAGDPDDPCLVLLHGWPQSSRAYAPVVDKLGKDAFVLAFDLPDVGESKGAPSSAEKTVLADLILSAAEALGGRDILVCGHDVGGMVTFSAARDHGARIVGAVVMNTSIPGIPPWDELMANPDIFHFAFHAVPDLPEALVEGRQRTYFDFFLNMMSGDQAQPTAEARAEYARAYARSESLKAGFDWYRAMPADAKHNARHKRIETPILYVRGDADGRSPEEFLSAFREAGVETIRGLVIAGGEFVAEEQPDRLVDALRDFREALSSPDA